ncbi:30S ribosomal protein S6 [Fontivita pretiosa]|jgi:small subunit ribosomal protein S6|uniref:30S ribosomal protein S6 n=1 Tax=Fontivita pretiosa TaxID=2989684 RepID=UPI003D165A25
MADATASKSERIRQYEAMFLFPAAASAELDKSLNTARSIIERHGGKIIVLKKWDERKLAYEIDGQKRGLYILSYFRAPGSAVAGIERDVNLSEEVLRVLVTHADHLNEQEMHAVEPQPIQPREERAPWDRPYTEERERRGPRREERERAGSEPAARE